ncbi:MAG: DUF6250 domain-containing protein [Gammaproteobacteria bacterium]
MNIAFEIPWLRCLISAGGLRAAAGIAYSGMHVSCSGDGDGVRRLIRKGRVGSGGHGFDHGDALKLAPLIVLLLLAPMAVLRAEVSDMLYREDFTSPAESEWGMLPDGWWLEGGKGGARARIHQGRLWIDANGPKIPGATVWLDRVFSGDIEVGFDVHVVASDSHANNMNFFFMFRDPANPSLRASAAERSDGRYPLYHSGRLRGTILTFLASENDPEEARVRLRQVPPFEPVLQEFTGYHARAGRTYRVTIARRGSRLTCEIDGRRVIDEHLPRPEVEGRPGSIGFRTWRSEVWWDNITVRRLSADAGG